jgi:hypothetical protein
VRAGIAACQNDKPRAIAFLDDAIAGFDEAEMMLYGHAARWQKGVLARGEDGAALVAQAAAFIEEQRVRVPERFVAMLAPGFPEL